MNFKLFLLVIALLMLVAPVFAQVSFHNLQKSESAFGIGYFQNTEDFGDSRLTNRTFQVGLHHSFVPNTKISLIPAVSFMTTTQNTINIPPSPSVDVRFLHTGAFTSTGLGYFLVGSAGIGYAQFGRNQTAEALHLVVTQFGGGGGILYRIDTNSELVLVPFFGVNVANQSFHFSTTRETILDETNTGYGGSGGIEIEFSPNMSITGTIAFSFTTPGTLFHFSLNFH